MKVAFFSLKGATSHGTILSLLKFQEIRGIHALTEPCTFSFQAQQQDERSTPALSELHERLSQTERTAAAPHVPVRSTAEIPVSLLYPPIETDVESLQARAPYTQGQVGLGCRSEVEVTARSHITCRFPSGTVRNRTQCPLS